jgi:alpha-aminoadipic semialdehyde synthase
MAAKTFGIRREDKNPWERRVAFIPTHITELKKQFTIDFEVQPSSIRAFPDEDYADAGAIISETLISSPIIFAIKEIPTDFFQAQKTYVFFSHTTKGQSYNMPMLQRMMDLGCNLIDYEKIVDDHGCRLIAFGYHAGIVGIVETLRALGQHLASEHIENPFSVLPPVYQVPDLPALKKIMQQVGEMIRTQGLPAQLSPFIVGITGYGNVSRGIQEILDLLPIQEVTPKDLPLHSNHVSTHRVYKVIFKEQDLMQHRTPQQPFNLEEYYSRPENYRSVFSRYLPYLTVVMNGIYWDTCYPRLITKKDVRSLFEKEAHPRLQIIGDISCDLGGSIEFTHKLTEPDNPVFMYNPLIDTAVDGYTGTGIMVMAVDNLPCELPRESSTYFSSVLKKFIPSFLAANFSQSLDESGLSPPLKKAVVLYQGNLTSPYNYLSKYLEGKKT